MKLLIVKKYYLDMDEQKIIDFVKKEQDDPINNDLEELFFNISLKDEYISTEVINYETKEHIITF